VLVQPLERDVSPLVRIHEVLRRILYSSPVCSPASGNGAGAGLAADPERRQSVKACLSRDHLASLV